MRDRIIRDQDMGQCYQTMQAYRGAEYAGVALDEYVSVVDIVSGDIQDEPVTEAVEEFMFEGGQGDAP